MSIDEQGYSCQKSCKQITYQAVDLCSARLTQQRQFTGNVVCRKKCSQGRHKKAYRGNVAASTDSIKHAENQ